MTNKEFIERVYEPSDAILYFKESLSRLEAAEKEIEAASNLLAIIHRDGGHHTGKVGFEQSCKDAQASYHKLQERITQQDEQIERLKDIIQKYLAHCGNNHQICGLNTEARQALK